MNHSLFNKIPNILLDRLLHIDCVVDNGGARRYRQYCLCYLSTGDALSNKMKMMGERRLVLDSVGNWIVLVVRK